MYTRAYAYIIYAQRESEQRIAYNLFVLIAHCDLDGAKPSRLYVCVCVYIYAHMYIYLTRLG